MTPILIDANNVIVRCCMATALEDLKLGIQPTGGVYGTLTSLVSAFNSMPYAGPAFAFFDCGVPVFRLEAIPEYKKKRKEKKETLTEEEKEKVFSQLKIAQCILNLAGVTCISFKNQEADDCIAAAVRIFKAEGVTPVVISTDKDLLQTVNMGAVVRDPYGDKITDEDNFYDLIGVRPEEYVVYRVLTGDTSDGIIGAKGCGPTRAKAIIEELRLKIDSESGGVFGEHEPKEQLGLIRDHLDDGFKKNAWQTAILDDYERLLREIQGINLADSFGDDTKMAARLEKLSPFLLMDFLKACREIGFKSVVGDPDRFTVPFRRAAKVQLT